jgi:hypothetical protein
LSPEDATTALSRHLGLEEFESLRDASDLTHTQENFVGQGAKNVLLVTVEESDANGVYRANHVSAYSPYMRSHFTGLSTTCIHFGDATVNPHKLIILHYIYIHSQS